MAQHYTYMPNATLMLKGPYYPTSTLNFHFCAALKTLNLKHFRIQWRRAHYTSISYPPIILLHLSNFGHFFPQLPMVFNDHCQKKPTIFGQKYVLSATNLASAQLSRRKQPRILSTKSRVKHTLKGRCNSNILLKIIDLACKRALAPKFHVFTET